MAFYSNIFWDRMPENAIKLSEWAKSKGLTYKGAWRMYKAGELPCHSEQLPTGTIIVYPDVPVNEKDDKVAIYARVHYGGRAGEHRLSEDRLDSQMTRLRDFAAARGLCVEVEKADIWDGVVDPESPPNLFEILEDPTVKTIIIESLDRLPHLSAASIEACLKGSGRTLVVINDVQKPITEAEMLSVVGKSCEMHFHSLKSEDGLVEKVSEKIRESYAYLKGELEKAKKLVQTSSLLRPPNPILKNLVQKHTKMGICEDEVERTIRERDDLAKLDELGFRSH